MATLKTVSTGDEGAIVAWYDCHADNLADAYERLDAAETHPELFAYARDASRLRILDVGCGSGRDAAAMAALGHEVRAVDPSGNMLKLAQALHPGLDIDWRRDALPDLSTTASCYDLILLSGVWMHIAPSERAASFGRLAALTAPGGFIYLTLRSGPDEPERRMWASSTQEVRRLAASHGMVTNDLPRSADCLGREGVQWRTVLVRRR